jgi:hypothetical protein
MRSVFCYQSLLLLFALAIIHPFARTHRAMSSSDFDNGDSSWSSSSSLPLSTPHDVNNIAAARDFRSTDWWFGVISRDQAEQIILQNPVKNTFLFRESAQTKNYALTLFEVDTQMFTHLLIVPGTHGGLEFSDQPGIEYPNLWAVRDSIFLAPFSPPPTTQSHMAVASKVDTEQQQQESAEQQAIIRSIEHQKKV